MPPLSLPQKLPFLFIPIMPKSVPPLIILPRQSNISSFLSLVPPPLPPYCACRDPPSPILPFLSTPSRHLILSLPYTMLYYRFILIHVNLFLRSFRPSISLGFPSRPAPSPISPPIGSPPRPDFLPPSPPSTRILHPNMLSPPSIITSRFPQSPSCPLQIKILHPLPISI
jgi:hypothetical protein